MTEQPDTTRFMTLLRLLRMDAEDGVAILELVKVGQREASIQAFERGKGHVPILIRAALLQRLLMTVTRHHDTAGDVDSLPTLFRLLDEADLQKALVSPELDEPMTFARNRWVALKDDPRVNRLRLFRNRFLAHSISQKWEFERPVFEDVTSTAVDTFAIVEALGVATATAPIFKHGSQIWRQRSEEFWLRLTRGAMSNSTLGRGNE
jgi:hypothetical protein